MLRSAPEAIDLAVLKLIAEDPAIAVKRGARRGGCGRHAACPISARSGRCIMRGWFAGCSATLARAATFPTNGSRPKSPGSTIWPATSRRSPTASPAFAAGPISPTAPTGFRIPRSGRNARARSKARLSDALHERLTQRFVDRRTAVLVRDIGARGADALPVTVAADGEVSVGPEPIGHLAGFEFRVDPSAKLADKRLLLAAAERRLGEELDRRATALIAAPDDAFELTVEDDGGVAVAWERPCARATRARPFAARAGNPHRSSARPAVGAQPRRASRPARAMARRTGRASI